MITMKMVEKKPKPTFCAKPTPNIRMNIGRKIDFGMLKAKNSSGFATSEKYLFSAIRKPISAPTGTASANAATTSVAVTARSFCMPARCSRSPSVTSVSDAEGSKRGLTMPVRDSISQMANNATTMPNRAALMANPLCITPALELGRDGLELGRDDLRRRPQILHAAGLGHVERELKLLRNLRSVHTAVGFQLHDRVVILRRRDVGGDFIELGDQLDGGFLVGAHVGQRAVKRVQRLLHQLRLVLRVFVERDPAGR